jgi:uncharacterized C2H2 Zn-finger protein
MVVHKCDNCTKIFNRLDHYMKHINRKNPCKYDNMVGSQKDHLGSQKDHLGSQKDHLGSHLYDYKCKHCNKIFKQNNNYNRHIRNNCKVQKESKEEKENIYQELIKQMKKLEDQNKELYEELKKMKSNTIIKNSNTITKNSNNTKNSSNNTKNSNNNTINLVAFGKEDLSHITEEVYKKILGKGTQSILELINNVHFNENKPEHCNVYISNIRDKYAMIYDGKEWILKNQDNVITDLLEYKKDNLIDKFDDLLDKLSPSTIVKFKRFLDKADDDETINMIKKDIKLLLYNKRKVSMGLTKLGE